MNRTSGGLTLRGEALDRKTGEGYDICGAGSEVGDEQEEMEAGMRKPERKHDPREPTHQERAEHELTHMPFRSWCRHCVRGRAKEEECRRNYDEVNKNEVHGDFMFMGEETGGRRWPSSC